MTAPARRRVYLAGPEVFLPDAAAIGDAKRAVCAAHGLEGVFPLDAEVDVEPLLADDRPTDAGLGVFDACIDLMASCDVVVANLTPWRGPSADVGTAVEVGWFLGRGLEVHGYSNVADDYAARIAEDGTRIEPFGFADNLMLEGAVRRAAGPIERYDAPADRRWQDLTAFTRCVARAAAGG